MYGLYNLSVNKLSFCFLLLLLFPLRVFFCSMWVLSKPMVNRPTYCIFQSFATIVYRIDFASPFIFIAKCLISWIIITVMSSLSSITIVTITITSYITIKSALGIVNIAIAECLILACAPYVCSLRFNLKIFTRPYWQAVMYCFQLLFPYCYILIQIWWLLLI